jgi:hypothetical protein
LAKEINGKIEARDENCHLCQIGTDATKRELHIVDREFAAERMAT